MTIGHVNPQGHTITRRGEGYRLEVADIEQFESWLLSHPQSLADGTAVVSDLAFGAWRAHQVASEFAEQLGFELPMIDKLPKHEGRDKRVSTQLLDQAVDAETRGHLGITAALAQAESVIQHVAQSQRIELIVIAPLDGRDFGSQNIRFLQFVTEGLRGYPNRPTIVANEDNRAWVPDFWTLFPSSWQQEACTGREKMAVDRRWASVPGVLRSSVCRSPTGQDSEAVLLPKGLKLLLPSQRAPGRVRRKSDVIAAREGAPPWVIAYQQACGLYPGSDLKAMGDYAWRSFQSGDFELGRRLLMRGLEVAGFPLPAGDLLVSLLAMQIASHRFQEAHEDPRRPRGVLLTMQRQWLRGKALCAALAGKGAEAETYLLESSDEPHQDPIEWEDLYARNLMALAYFLQKKGEEALALQESIHRTLSETDEPTWQIRYLNAINTARLQRAAGRFEIARDHYHAAFKLTDGVRVDGDFLYMNVCLARIEENLGNRAAAGQYWLKAALHFAANPVPESLGWRTLAAILKRRVASGECCVDEVARCLTSSLRESMNLRETDYSPTVTYAHAASANVLLRCQSVLSGEGWAVLILASKLAPHYDSQPHRAFRSVLLAALCQTSGFPIDQRVTGIVVDAQFGREVPATLAEVMDMGARYRVSRLTANGKEHQFDAKQWSARESESFASIGPAVSEIFPAGAAYTIVFRRHFAPISASGMSADALKGVLEASRIREIAHRYRSSDLLEQLRTLEANRVVVVYGT